MGDHKSIIMKFDAQQVKNMIRYKYEEAKKFKRSLKITHELLAQSKHLLIYDPKSDVPFSLSEANWYESKNYDYLAVEFNTENYEVELTFRTYKTHLIVFCKTIPLDIEIDEEHESARRAIKGLYAKTSIFTVYSDSDLMTDEESDCALDDPYQYFDAMFPKLVEMIDKDILHLVWNDLSLPRPKHTKVKLVYDQNGIRDIDDYIIAMEELSNIQLELYAEKVILPTIKNWIEEKIPIEKFTVAHSHKRDAVKILSIHLDESYLHGTGIKYLEPATKHSEEKETFVDIYYILHWMELGWHELVESVETYKKQTA